MVNIKVSWSDAVDRDLGLPTYETVGAAGADLRANLPDDLRDAGIEISPGGRALIPTGLRLEIPVGYEVQVRARSGLALKHGVTLANAIGTIDSDYRGDLGVILWNGGGRCVPRDPWNADRTNGCRACGSGDLCDCRCT